MSDETRAPSPAQAPPAAGEEADYHAICGVLAETARGRWFLAEHARRARKADASLVLAALERIELALAGDRTPRAIDDLRAQVAEAANAVVRDLGARIDALIELSGRATPGAQQIAPGRTSELGAVQPEAKPEPAALAHPGAGSATAPAQPGAPQAEKAQADGLIDRIELPAVSFVHGSSATPSEVSEARTPIEPPKLDPSSHCESVARIERSEIREGMSGEVAPGCRFAPSGLHVAAASDPLAAVMALSEEEKIALFG